MKDQVVARLRALRAATDDAIGRIEAAGGCPGAINWADLSCTEARHVLSNDGSEREEVLIEEAAPENRELQARVAGQLAAAGWPDVSVVTEW